MAFDLVRTTYGPAALDALAAAVARAKGDEPLRPVTVVVPSNYAGVAARRALARRHGVIGVGFVTLYRLAELLAGPTLARSGRVPVSSPVVATAFRAALAEDPGLFGPVADQPSTVEALRRVHRELRDLDDLQRHRLAQSDARAAAVVAIDERVTERLQTRWHDETDLMVTAAALVRGGDAAVDVGPLVVHLPQQISSSAARLLQAVAAHAPVTVIAGVTGRADAPVERLLGRLDLAAVTPTRRRPRRPGLPPEPSVELTVAADEDDEVRTALRRVVEAAEAGVALERIAIVHAPRAPYGRLLSEHLTAARLPWNGITASSVAERVAGRTLLGLLDLDAAALRRRDVFALLASVPPSRRRPVAAWERQARRARVVSGRRAVGRAAGGAGGGSASPSRRRGRRGGLAARGGRPGRRAARLRRGPGRAARAAGGADVGRARPVGRPPAGAGHRRARAAGTVEPRGAARRRAGRAGARPPGPPRRCGRRRRGPRRRSVRVPGRARRRAGRRPGHRRAAGRGDLRRPDPAGGGDRRRPGHRPRPGRGRPARRAGRRPPALGPHPPHARRRAHHRGRAP